jgi:hypothetical protein
MIVKMWDHEGVLLGHFWTVDGTVHASPGLEYILKPPYEVYEPSTGKLLTAEDGDRFLKVLPVMFGGYGNRAVLMPGRKVPVAAA